MERRAQLALELASEACETIRTAFARSNHRTSEKSANDFATDTDVAIEHRIAQRIAETFPGDTVLGEEGGQRVVGSAAATGVRWIVDPLDGTYNFVHGFPYVATSIAIEEASVVQFGVVGAALQHELFYARLGHGAWLKSSKTLPQKISVSPCAALSKALVGTVLPSGANTAFERVLPAFVAVARASGSVRRTGAAALDLAQVAAGRLDGFFVMSLAAWDAAAGALLVREAGGTVCDFRGEGRFLETNQVIAGTLDVARALAHVLRAHATDDETSE